MATPASTQKIKTRILIISDTHNRPLKNESHTQPFREPLPAADVLIHCGDMTMTGLLPQYHTTLDTLKAIDAPLKLVIAGNHDRTLDRTWMETHEHIQRNEFSEARELWVGEEGRARKEGVTFLDEGVHRFELENGARLSIYASPYTPEFYDWGFPYEKHEDRFNPTVLNDATSTAVHPIPSSSPETQIDILVTHGPPYKRLDQTSRGGYAGCPHLLRGLMRARPLVHCFGHIHEGWGAEIVTWKEKAGDIAQKAMTTAEWLGGGWQEGVEGEITAIEADVREAKKRRCISVDVAEGSGQELERGRQTLLVNSAIVNVAYEPVNAPFLVDVDLPGIA